MREVVDLDGNLGEVAEEGEHSHFPGSGGLRGGIVVETRGSGCVWSIGRYKERRFGVRGVRASRWMPAVSGGGGHQT